MKHLHRQLLLGGLVLSLSNGVFADDDDESAEDDEALWELDLGDILDIKVSVASSFAETDLETGSTVALVEKRQWERYGANTVTEAIGHLPGTYITPTLWGGSIVPIRGYASTLSVRGIAVVIDGVPLNNANLGTSLYSIRSFVPDALDRIEMIRGPGSALYGSDAFHGVISMKTHHSDEDMAEVGAKATSNGVYQAATNVSQSLSDTFSVDLSLAGTQQDAQDTPYTFTTLDPTPVQASSTRADEFDALTAIVKLHGKFSDDVKGSFNIYHVANENIGGFGVGQGIGTNDASLLQGRDLSSSDNNKTILKLDLEAQVGNDMTFQAKAYQWSDEYDLFTNFSVLGFDAITTLLVEEETYGIDLLLKQAENSFNTQWAVGLSYKDNEIGDVVTELFFADGVTPIIENILAPSEGFTRDVTSFILEARSKFVDDTFHVLYGGRFDKYSDFGNQTTPRLGLVYLKEQQSVKLLYGEAFRAPVASELRGAGQTQGNPDLDPEIIQTLELVYMYKSDSWKFNATLFQSDWTDGIVNVAVPPNPNGFLTTYENTGENEAEGLELSFIGTHEDWSYDLSASYVESVSITGGVETDYVAFPKYILNLNFGYNFPEHKVNLYVANRIHLDTKESPISGGIPNPADLDDYFSTNVNVEWQASEQVLVNFSAINLFDQDNITSAPLQNENGLQDSDHLQRFQLSAKYSF